jgi:hypothetical protein
METKKIAIIALAFLFLAGAIFSQTFQDFKDLYGDVKSGFQKRIGDGSSWMLLAIAAIMACLFFNVLLYMGGMTLQSEELKRYAQSEFLQVSASALMVFFAVSLLYALTNGGAGISGLDFMGNVLGGASHIDCAAVSGGVFNLWQDYPDFGSGPLGAFKCKVQEKITALDAAYNNAVETNMPMEQAASLCINLFGVPVYCGDWDLSLHNQVEKSHLIASKIVGLLMPLHAQFVLAQYLQNNMLQIFLPAGLVLRILPFTRGVGGLFIAIAIGFFFIFPTFFLLTDPTFVKADSPQRNSVQGMCFTGFRGASVVLAGVLSSTAVASQSALASASAEELVFQITIATLFYPFVALVLTLIFIRAMTPLLGGDLGELMRMVSRLG